MTNSPRASDEPSRGGCLFALALFLAPPIAFVATGGGEIAYNMPGLLLHGAILALPFGYLALDGTKAWLPWVVVAGLTILFWGAYLASVIISARDRSGLNFGMLLVMLTSPFVISACAWAAVRVTRR